MNILSLLRERFAAALEPLADEPPELLDMVRPSQDARFGDYQANCAMPLGKRLSRPPREVAQEIVDRLDVKDIAEPPEIAGPGFINVRLKQSWLQERLTAASDDLKRLGLKKVRRPRTYLIDYSAPNVAKPMHVGHIRSTVIGDSLYRLLGFLGHRVISDNHLGDWGTQFGMIIYAFKHFLDEPAYERDPVAELSRLYRLVNQVIEYQQGRAHGLPELEEKCAAAQAELDQLSAQSPAGDKSAEKKHAKAVRRGQARTSELTKQRDMLSERLAALEKDAEFMARVEQHADLKQRVLEETAKLHAGYEENRRLWNEFLPPCLAEIEKTYKRLNITFDHTLGESFYHDRLPEVVRELRERGIAVESEGAMCVFLEGFPAPMIVQKRDGAYLYATTDLATIRYRMQEFQPDAILYVVDHRQSLHFEQLFATARKWGYGNVELQHIKFGTVLGEDGRPYKTRSGDTVGLMGLLDDAVREALQIVSENDDAKEGGPELSDHERREVAEVVGIGGLKYADLAQNRESDYKFSYAKMLAKTGNTATYMQYAYARVRSIFAEGGMSAEEVRRRGGQITIDHPAEHALGLMLLRLPEALDEVAESYEPHHLAAYLFELAGCYSTFYNECRVLKAETDALRQSRLLLCDLTARTIRLGLKLLGIEVVEKM